MLKQLHHLILVMLIGTLITGGAAVTAQDEPYAPDIDPANFVEGIDHPYMPWSPGTTYVYEGETKDGVERIEVFVTYETKEIMGITCTVVRDTVWEDGELVEDTLDWFAQDKDGNVWYMGEDSKNYEDGVVVSTAGSWEAGVDGALPGIIMPADPQPGDSYRQEYYEGEAEDMAEVVSLTEAAEVPYGEFDDLLMTLEWNPLEPDVTENKYYAAGVGLILEDETGDEGDGERVELVDIVMRDMAEVASEDIDASCTPEKPSGWTAYVVQPGDTLEDLAAIIGTSSEELEEANCIPDADNLVVGSVFYGPPLGSSDAEMSSEVDEVIMEEDEDETSVDEGGLDEDEIGGDVDEDEGDDDDEGD